MPNDRFKDIPLGMMVRNYDFPKLWRVGGVTFNRICLISDDSTHARIAARTIRHELLYEIRLEVNLEPSLADKFAEYCKYGNDFDGFERQGVIARYDGVLSTCHFLKSEGFDSSTAGWSVYRNEKLGFEVKYPAGSRVCTDDSVAGCNTEEHRPGVWLYRLEAAGLMGDDWEGVVAKIILSDEVFLSQEFKHVTIPTPEHGAVYLAAFSDSQTIGRWMSVQSVAADFSDIRFRLYESSDCHTGGCDGWDAYYHFRNNTCFVICFATSGHSGYSGGAAKCARGHELLAVDWDRERFGDFCRQLVSTFRFLK